VKLRDRQQRIRGLRPHGIRPTLVILGLLACLLLLPAATANADVMAKYRTKYKSKLTYYRNQMDREHTFFTAYKQAAESTSHQLGVALADTEHPENIGIIKQVAVDQRSLMQADAQKSRDRIYANIAAFKATAVKWFRTTADKNRFKTRLAILKSGFKQIFSADESLMSAFNYLGINADVSTANNEIMAAGMTSVTAEDQFGKGLRLLRALQ
jgi:hypothetical protein